MALGVGLSGPRAEYGTDAFVTPTLIRFGGVLLQCMVVLFPWPSAWPVGIILGLFGLIGLAMRMPSANLL
jgi:hypothetical protein